MVPVVGPRTHARAARRPPPAHTHTHTHTPTRVDIPHRSRTT
jgi:hypothetical protein